MQSGLQAIFATLGALLALGCVHGPQKGSVARPDSGRVRLASLPVESDAFPQLAEWMNNLLEEARVAGVDDYFRSQVTLEVVQLSIECVDPTPTCYAAAGRSLSSNQLLFAQIQGGSRRRDKSVHVTVTLFDADTRAPVQIRTRVYKDQQAALADVEELVQEVTASTGGPPEATGAGSSQARAPAHSAGTSAGTRRTSR